MKSAEEIQKIAEVEFPVIMGTTIVNMQQIKVDKNHGYRSGYQMGYTKCQEDMQKGLEEILSRIYDTRQEVILGAFRMECIDGRLMLNEFESIGIKIEAKF